MEGKGLVTSCLSLSLNRCGWVAGALLVTLAVLAASIGVLQKRENVLDEREKLLTAHAFL